MKKIALSALVCAALFCSSAIANNRGTGAVRSGPDAANASLTNVVSFADECGGVSYDATLTVTGTVNDGGGNDVVWFTIFDDGTEKAALSFSVPVGQTQSFPIAVAYPGGVAPGAPGIGVYVGESRGGDELISIDPFFPTAVTGCNIGQANFHPAPGPGPIALVLLTLSLLGFGAIRLRS
jgi:hypothetical protein